MRRAHHPCRMRQRFRHRVHRDLQVHRLDVERRSRRRYQHLVRHRNLDEQLRHRNRLGDPDRQRLLDVDHRDDPERRHLPDVDHPGGQRLPGLVDPCPAMEQTGCFLDEPLGVECPCPVTRRTGCFPGVECLALNLARVAWLLIPPKVRLAQEQLVTLLALPKPLGLQEPLNR